MIRSWIGVLVVAMLTSCAQAPKKGFDERVFGRWDATVLGEDSYPLWFELSKEGDAVKGRLQPRTGHALALEKIDGSGSHVMMELEGTTYHGSFDGTKWTGTGEPKTGSRFDWTAVPAPELPAPKNPQFGEPIHLFNGTDLTGWAPRGTSEPNRWKAENAVLVNEDKGSDLMTEAKFQDFELHIEVNVPPGSNSGIYLRGRYEVQVQDDYGKPPGNLQMGAVYGQITPRENAALKASEWQSFDITLLGRFVTVVLNGKTIIENQEIPGTTGGALDSSEAEPGPIFLQGDHGRILYRNIVLKPVV